jgi:hypothetical protein
MSSVFRAIALGLLVWLSVGFQARASVAILADGADGNSARIAIRSAIGKGDLAAFQSAIDKVSRTATTKIAGVPFITVELNSPGGDVVEALGIGRVLYQHSAFTMVRPGRECVSACVFILAAGAVRSPLGSANIGVHKPLLVAWHRMNYAQARTKYDGLMQYVRQYFLDLGVSGDAYDIMMRTDASDMRYFSPAELARLGLRGQSPDWLRHYGPGDPTPDQSDSAPPATSAAAPQLPALDESFRYVVFMPGNLSRDDYYAGTELATPRFTWDSLDGYRQAFTANAPDVVGMLKAIYRAVWPIVAPIWWLALLLLFELARGRYAAWPDTPRLDQDRQDRWRLAPFRPYERD